MMGVGTGKTGVPASAVAGVAEAVGVVAEVTMTVGTAGMTSEIVIDEALTMILGVVGVAEAMVMIEVDTVATVSNLDHPIPLAPVTTNRQARQLLILSRPSCPLVHRYVPATHCRHAPIFDTM